MKMRLVLAAAAALAAAGIGPSRAGLGPIFPPFTDRTAWATEVSPSGTVFFDCLVPACGAGSIVSVAFFTDVGPQAPIKEQAAAYREAVLAGGGVTAMVVTAARADEPAPGIAAQDFDYRFTYAPGRGDPDAVFWTSGEFSEAAERTLVSISSSSGTAATALANYNEMLFFLLNPARPPLPGEPVRRTN